MKSLITIFVEHPLDYRLGGFYQKHSRWVHHEQKLLTY